MVRAKMELVYVRTDEYPHGGESKRVVFQPRYDTSIPEDQRFQKATPSGELWMQLDNPEALKFFQEHKSFYIDFTPVPKAEPAK